MRLSVPFLKFQVPIRLFVRAGHFGLKRATGSPSRVSSLIGDLGLRWATIGARVALKFGDEVKAFSQCIPLRGRYPASGQEAQTAVQGGRGGWPACRCIQTVDGHLSLQPE